MFPVKQLLLRRKKIPLWYHETLSWAYPAPHKAAVNSLLKALGVGWWERENPLAPSPVFKEPETSLGSCDKHSQDRYKQYMKKL